MAASRWEQTRQPAAGSPAAPTDRNDARPRATSAARAAFESAVARDVAQAHRLVWLGFWTMLVSVGVGLPWDVAWHVSRRFETVFSPPHLFVYATTVLTITISLSLVVAPRTRRLFGRGVTVPGISISVPAPLFLVGAGLGLLGLGAILDVIWHSAFGLDETRWSTPHAMLGWGWGLAAFGFVTARIALSSRKPLHWWTRAFIGLVLLGFSVGPLLGPFGQNQTVEKVQAVAAIPVLTDQAAYQHTARIYQDWKVVRAHPAFVALGAFWLGLMLMVLRALDRRLVFTLLLVTFWTIAAALRDRGAASRLGLDVAQFACWAPIPILPAALVSALAWTSGRGHLVSAFAGGATFGLCCQLLWPSVGLTVGLAIGATFATLGALAGRQVGATLVRPTARRCVALALASLIAPLASGVIDLYLRSHTP